ncbi:hypothetical protein ABT294_36930 [Nonomuraea sp. NPDC000554]
MGEETLRSAAEFGTECGGDRDAGLLESHRRGNQVLYKRTPLVDPLIDRT